MELTNEDISAFVKANIDNPKAIWTAIFQNNVGFDRVAEASGYSTDQMKQYFVDAGLMQGSTTNPSPTASQEPGTNTAPTATKDQSVYPTTNTAPSTPAASPATPTALQAQQPAPQGNVAGSAQSNGPYPLVSFGPGGGYDPWAKPQQPAYAGLSSTSFPSEIARAYHEWSAANGGDTPANQAAAQNYLSSLGINQNTIEAAYNAYQAPVSSVRQAPVAPAPQAQQPAPQGNSYTAPSTPAASPATPTALQPLYAGLSNNSNAADIAAAYREWAGASGGDTTENQRTAESYLSNLGIGSGAIRDAYNAYTAPTAAAVTPVGSNLGLGGNYETAQTYTPTVAGPAVQAASTGYTASTLAPAVIATATPFTAAQSGPAAQATGARYVPTTLGNATQATATGYNATRANLGLGLQSLGASDPTQANAKLLSGQVNNPYLDAQADNITRRLNRNLQENILPGIGQGATMAGQYGGSRQGIAQGKAIGDTNDNLANALTNMYSGANEAAQSRMAGAAGSLTGIGASLEGQNANAANQAAQFGAASTNAASLYNAGAQNNFGLANQAALNQAGQFNAGLAAQNSQFNAGQYNQNQQFNTSAQNAVNAQNTAAANNMSQFNAGAQNNFGLANQAALNQAGQFGAASTNAASLYNAGAQNSLNQYNAGMQNQAGQFNAGATNNYNLGLRSSDLGFANLDANIAQNNFANQLGMANFGLGVYNTMNGQTQQGINAGTNIQNTPLDYQKYFTNSANGVGSGYSTGTTSQTNQGNPLLGALGGAQIGNAWQYPNGRNDIGIYGPGRVSGVNYG